MNNKLFRIISLVIFLLVSHIFLFGAEPGNPGGDPHLGGNPPLGGGAPIENGMVILIILGAAYGVYKIWDINRKRISQKNTQID